MKILGISAHYHDSAAALVVDGLPVASVQEERLSRRKNDAAFPMAAIEWCLEAGGLAEIIASVILTLQFYVLLPPFAWAARRQARAEAAGWTPIEAGRNGALDSQY